ncbi:MAG: hypothetical protein ACO1QB_08390 [Verrucomicrobiales bacterium]
MPIPFIRCTIGFVKDFLHDPASAADVFRSALTQGLVSQVQWEQLRQEHSEFSDEHLGQPHHTFGEDWKTRAYFCKTVVSF